MSRYALRPLGVPVVARAEILERTAREHAAMLRQSFGHLYGSVRLTTRIVRALGASIKVHVVVTRARL